MIVPKIIKGSDFTGLVHYLLSDQKAVPLGHIVTCNIMNLQCAADEMAMIAGLKPKVADPVCHIVISWAADENPNVAQQLQAGHEVLKALKFDNHQYVLVVHTEEKNGLAPGPNGRHYELHAAVNRVALDGSVNNLSWSYAVAECAAADISRRMGFSVVPGRFNGLGIHKPGLNGTIGTIRAQSGRLTIAEELRSDPAKMDALKDARSKDWAVFIATLRNFGIELCVARFNKGEVSGLTMVDRSDPRRRMALSNLENGLDRIKWGYGALAKDLGLLTAQDLQRLPKLDDVVSGRSARRYAAEENATRGNGRPRNTADFEAFEVAKATAIRLREEQAAQWRQEREAIYRRSKKQRERRYALKALRQRLLRQFFGRHSLAAMVINVLCDFDYNRDIKTISATRKKDLAKIRARAIAARTPIPTWTSWKRALEIAARSLPTALYPANEFNTNLINEVAAPSQPVFNQGEQTTVINIEHRTNTIQIPPVSSASSVSQNVMGARIVMQIPQPPALAGVSIQMAEDHYESGPALPVETAVVQNMDDVSQGIERMRRFLSPEAYYSRGSNSFEQRSQYTVRAPEAVIKHAIGTSQISTGVQR
ncbi:MAG: relaxase/mobilization nuclease domain-containing protein [Xanthobacteraceae bacterium]|nr:relaxase/mobilization nuclease domain-containing protein [Xanthobacteraceae bacterium]